MSHSVPRWEGGGRHSPSRQRLYDRLPAAVSLFCHWRWGILRWGRGPTLWAVGVGRKGSGPAQGGCAGGRPAMLILHPVGGGLAFTCHGGWEGGNLSTESDIYPLRLCMHSFEDVVYEDVAGWKYRIRGCSGLLVRGGGWEHLACIPRTAICALDPALLTAGPRARLPIL